MGSSDRKFDRLLLIAALAGAGVRALTAPGLGDYPWDAGPALSAIAHGSLSGFFSHQPAMGGVALYARVPFVGLAAALHDSPLGVYRWGALPCLLAVAVLAVWLARIAARRGTGRAGQVLIVAICLLNPLVNDALYWGHPEELLATSLAVGALVAAAEGRLTSAAVLTGLAVATKQWALLVVCPVLFMCDRRWLRAGLVMLATAAAGTLPMLVANLAAFRHTLAYISKPQPFTSVFDWLYPFVPTGRVSAALPFGDFRTYTGHILPGWAGVASHPLIIALGVIVPAAVWLRRGRRLASSDLFLSAALVFLLRCTLDPGSSRYYHLPLLMALVALDATTGAALPVAGLAAFAGAFVFLDRLGNYVSNELASLLYIAATLTLAALLVHRGRVAEVGGVSKHEALAAGHAGVHAPS
jgi:hypothetical protein